MADDVIEKPNSTETFIDKLASDDNAGAGEAFKDAMRQKVGDALDASRKDYASNLFNAARDVMTGQTTPETAEPHSDPKPEVAEPFTQLLLKMRCNKHFNKIVKRENKNGINGIKYSR